jgi:glycine/D-amino acid oxidase-like deaminating enzyme
MDVMGSVYFPIDAHLTPRKLMPALLALLKDMGVRFQWNTSVYGWRAEGGRIAGVQTSGGDLTADEYVLAGGSWSPSMVANLGIRLPMQAGKGYSLTLDQPRFRLTKSLILTERRVAVTPMGDKLRFGGTMEISGINDTIRPERVQQIIDAVPHYFPDFNAADFAGVKPWFGLRPVSPDGLPYVGRFRLRPRHAWRHDGAVHGPARGGGADRSQAERRSRPAQPRPLCLSALQGGARALDALRTRPEAAFHPNLFSHELERCPPRHHDQPEGRPVGRSRRTGRPLPLDDRQRLHRHRLLRLARRGGDAHVR